MWLRAVLIYALLCVGFLWGMSVHHQQLTLWFRTGYHKAKTATYIGEKFAHLLSCKSADGSILDKIFTKFMKVCSAYGNLQTHDENWHISENKYSCIALQSAEHFRIGLKSSQHCQMTSIVDLFLTKYPCIIPVNFKILKQKRYHCMTKIKYRVIISNFSWITLHFSHHITAWRYASPETNQ